MTDKNGLPISRKLVVGGSFSEEDALSHRTNFNDSTRAHYPYVYDHEIFECVTHSELYDSTILDRRLNHAHTNWAWVGDQNPRYDDIRKNMVENEFVFNYLPWLFLERIVDGVETYVLMDRRTTDEIVCGKDEGAFEFTNFIGSKFKVRTHDRDTGKAVAFTDSQIDDALSKFGTTANVRSDVPRGKVTTEDLFSELKSAVNNNWISRDKYGLPNYEKTMIRINEICGHAFLGKKKRMELAARLRNFFDTSNKTRGWRSTVPAKAWLTDENRNYKDIDAVYDYDENFVTTCTKKGIKYVIVQYNVNDKLGTVARLYEEEPNYEYRVVIFTGILTGYDTRENFWKRVNSFRDEWNRSLEIISKAYFKGVDDTIDNIKLYGAIPMIEAESDPDLPGDVPQVLDKMIHLKSDGTWVQK